MGGRVSKNAVATGGNATATAPFDHIDNKNDCNKTNTNAANAINDPGKTNTKKNEAGKSRRPVIDDFNLVKKNENKASDEHHSGTDVQQNAKVGEKTKSADQALEDHHPGMISKENIQTRRKSDRIRNKNNMKEPEQKAQDMMVVEDMKDTDEDVEGKKRSFEELKTELEEETPNAKDIVAEDMKEKRKKKRKIARKMDKRKIKRKRRTL